MHFLLHAICIPNGFRTGHKVAMFSQITTAPPLTVLLFWQQRSLNLALSPLICLTFFTSLHQKLLFTNKDLLPWCSLLGCSDTLMWSGEYNRVCIAKKNIASSFGCCLFEATLNMISFIPLEWTPRLHLYTQITRSGSETGGFTHSSPSALWDCLLFYCQGLLRTVGNLCAAKPRIRR